MNTAGGRRGGGGEESEDEGYEIDEVRDSSKWSWKRPMKALRRELSGDGLGRDGLGREGAWSTGTRLERLVIHPDNWYCNRPPLSLSLTLCVYMFFRGLI
jgi:hypothetical protein